jgi:hypothetical protein
MAPAHDRGTDRGREHQRLGFDLLSVYDPATGVARTFRVYARLGIGTKYVVLVDELGDEDSIVVDGVLLRSAIDERWSDARVFEARRSFGWTDGPRTNGVRYLELLSDGRRQHSSGIEVYGAFAADR